MHPYVPQMEGLLTKLLVMHQTPLDQSFQYFGRAQSASQHFECTHLPEPQVVEMVAAVMEVVARAGGGKAAVVMAAAEMVAVEKELRSPP